MKATTIKVEGELLAELERAKPATQSLSTYVRSVLRQEVRRQQMAAAADRYTEFLEQHADERAWLDESERADRGYSRHPPSEQSAVARIDRPVIRSGDGANG